MAESPMQELQQAINLHSAGRLVEAEQIYHSILVRHPDEPNCLHMIGVLLLQQGDLVAAEPFIKRSLELVPIMPDWHNDYAVLLYATGHFDLAEKHLRRAVQLNPLFAEAHYNLGKCLYRKGQPAIAIEHWRQVVLTQPTNVDVLVKIGGASIKLHKLEEAMGYFQQALNINPKHLAATINAARILFHFNRLDEATNLYHQAVEADPQNVEVLTNLGICLLEQGDFAKAIDCYRKALSIQPKRAEVRSNLLLAMHYDPAVHRAELFEEHLEYARIHEAPILAFRFKHQNSTDSNRPIKIAYVSGDFRRHAVASFIEPILRHHDRSKFIVSCYSANEFNDQTTSRLRSYTERWHEVADLNEEQLAQIIHANCEDIVIDLSAHTGRGRLPALARKPAPIQINYLGYLNTTGLNAMDYRVSDEIADPQPNADDFHTEKLLRLPCFFCYQPPDESPPVGPLPALMAGHVTFGSMNQCAKFNPRVLDLWTDLLKAVPSSRLVLAVNAPGESVRRLFREFERRGIEASRLTIHPRRQYGEYLAIYNAIDIALDPFPFSGHTTSCDALWMGVPVVTWPGDTYASRTCTSVLTHLKLNQFIATDASDYLDIATQWAANLQSLGELRASLRGQMQGSVITDAAAFTNSLEQAYRRIWLSWCENNR
ncbi:MAG TPA: tetratricopeptide repeat protein [Tepidisphaeraceae bacterium]|nr:tetratricopeptide repeat protein [Tepidisphaeraceae bacterium]